MLQRPVPVDRGRFGGTSSQGRTFCCSADQDAAATTVEGVSTISVGVRRVGEPSIRACARTSERRRRAPATGIEADAGDVGTEDRQARDLGFREQAGRMFRHARAAPEPNE
jgi:hypothetical protein